MATVLGLAMRITADASGLAKSLTPVDRALQSLGQQADKSATLFDTFRGSTAGAAAAQEAVRTQFEQLTNSLREGGINAEQFAEQFAAIQESARQTASEFARGLQITEQSKTAEERRAEQLSELNRLLELGAISQETFERAAAEASGANQAAAEAERERAAAIAQANSIIQANLTPQERYDAQVQELRQHLDEGRISQETFDRALAKASASFEKAAAAAGDYDKAADGAGRGGALAFNELSGILSALPGPLGNVAGRLSGLSSASEGLGRVFAGGLTQGIQGITGGITNLVSGINPAVAGLAAFAAGSTAVAQSLIALEGRVEQLGRLADQLGVSFEFVQTLEEAGRRADVSVQTLSGSFARLQNTLAGADEESKKATEALSRLGLSVQEFSALSQQEQIDLIGEKLASIENPAQRSAAAIALFGRSGVQLLPFFNELDQASADMERFGGAVSELDRQRLADFGAGLDALGVATRTLGQELTLPFTGLGEGIAKATAEIIGGFNSIVGPIGDVLEPLLTNIGRAVELLGVGLGNIGRLIGAVLTPLGDAVQFIGQVLEPINEAFVDLIRYISDGTVRVAEWLQSFNPIYAITDAFGGAAEAAEAVSSVVSRVTRIVSAAVSQFAKFFQDTIGRVLERIGAVVGGFTEWLGLGDAFDTFGGFFTGLWDTIKSVVAGIGGFIDRVLRFAEDWLGIKAVAEEPVEIEIDDGGRLEEILAENKEFQRVLDGITQSVSDAINESAEFGEAGFDAALKYQESVKDLQEQLDRGLINEAVFEAEARKAGELFKREIDRIEEDAQLEIQIKENAEKAVARVREELSKAIDESAQFGKAGFDAAIEYQKAVESLQEQFENGIINENTLQKEAEKANKTYEERIKTLEDARKEQEKLIEDDRKRIDEMLAKDKELAKAEEDILAVRREQERLAASLAAGAGDTTAQQQRLSELEQLEARLEDQQQAIEQGFGEGFQAAFDAVTNDIDGLIDRAAEFGNEGAVAAQRLQDGIAAAQEQARAGILNAEAFEAEVQRQQQLFEGEIARIEEVEQFRQQMREEAVAAEQERLEAIAEAQREAEQQREQVRQERERQFFEEQRKAAEAEAKRQEQRIRALNTLGAQTIQSGDIRTAEGAALVQRLAAEAQDPALIEQRRQTKLLQQISAGIAGAAANYFDSPVEIVGFARIGGIP